MSLAQVILHPRRAQPFFGRHPWVFTGAIQEVRGDPIDGAEVEVRTHAGTFVARGYYNSKSKIRVRLYCWEKDRPLDDEFFRAKFLAAFRFRENLFGKEPSLGYRAISSEGDGISGLIVDRYNDWLTVQFTSLALGQRREKLAPILADISGCKGIYVRTERGIGKLEGLDLQDGPLWGDAPKHATTIDDGIVRYRVDIREGQKTGFFLDQRTNRLAVARYLTGRTVLDCFCYSGGFGLHAAKRGAASVEAVDMSDMALALAHQNADLNGVGTIQFVKADVFDHLNALITQRRKFGAVILDPPKFARTKKSVKAALRGYRTMMGQAIRLLQPEGVLVMCCCSGLIAPAEIESVLGQVAVDVRREVQILERRGQDIDHPISVTCPQTSYLKCFICRVL